MVRDDFGLRIANAIARRMVAPVHREGGQSQYVEAPAGTSQDDNFGPMLDWVVEHIDEPMAVGAVARRFGFSLRTFQRRFKNVTGLTPHQWLIQPAVDDCLWVEDLAADGGGDLDGPLLVRAEEMADDEERSGVALAAYEFDPEDGGKAHFYPIYSKPPESRLEYTDPLPLQRH